METRKASLELLIKYFEKKQPFEDLLDFYSKKSKVPFELSGLVSGTVKNIITIDYYLSPISNKPMEKLSYAVKNALRLAVYEIEYRKNPDYAVINSYVELVKKYEPKAVTFINGVLRNFLRKRNEISFPDINSEPIKHISVKYSHPEWMIEKWLKTYGQEETIKICEYNNKPSQLILRVNLLKIQKQELIELFKNNSIEHTASLVKDCLKVKFHGSIKKIPGFKEGFWIVQGESSSIVAHVLDPKQDEDILDLCAAPGGKTAHISALMENTGKITAVDINSERIKKIDENLVRLGINNVETISCDASFYKSEKLFDRILVDVPCSNTGVLAKRPDARWNRTDEDIKNLAKLQLKILNNASKYLKPNGILVYSTCSIEPEENTEIINSFLELNPDFKLDEIAKYLPFDIKNDSGFYQIIQSGENMDGFFIAKLKYVK
jgi:16S rRNA (cytosine967-C5)-methyltransferase